MRATQGFGVIELETLELFDAAEGDARLQHNAARTSGIADSIWNHEDPALSLQSRLSHGLTCRGHLTSPLVQSFSKGLSHALRSILDFKSSNTKYGGVGRQDAL